MEAERIEAIRTALEADKASIERQLAEYGAGDVLVDEGFADSAQATAERSELLSLVEQLKSTHDEVEAALDRIERGAYGRCEACGGDIAIERLEAIPTARLCVSCKQAQAV